MRIRKVGADPRGDVLALVEERGSAPASEATVHVFDGTRGTLLASFDGPALMYLRIAALGDRVIVGDYRTGKIVGFALDGRVAWGPLAVEPETLDALCPSFDGRALLACWTERGAKRPGVLLIDPKEGRVLADVSATFANLPYELGRMWLAACRTDDSVFIVSGWASAPEACQEIRESAARLHALLGTTPVVRVARLVGLVLLDGAMRVLWEHDVRVLDTAALSDGGAVCLVQDERDEATSLMWLDTKTGVERQRVPLAPAPRYDASLFAAGTRLVTDDGRVVDTQTGALLQRLF